MLADQTTKHSLVGYSPWGHKGLNKERIVRSDEDWFVQGMQG